MAASKSKREKRSCLGKTVLNCICGTTRLGNFGIGARIVRHLLTDQKPVTLTSIEFARSRAELQALLGAVPRVVEPELI